MTPGNLTPGKWEKARLAAAAAVLGLFIFSALPGGGSLSRTVSALLSKIQLVPALIRALSLSEGFSFSAVTGLASAVLIIVSVILAGRLYCSTLCPFGLFQDIFIESTRAKAGKKAGRYSYIRPHSNIRYTILLVCGLFAAAGIMIPLILLEPYSLWGRLTQDLFYPVTVFFNRIYFLVMSRFGRYISITDYYFNLPVVAVTFISITAVVFFTLKKGRIYCSIICPAGTLLGLCTRFSLSKVSIDSEKCTSCRLCEKACRTGCINTEAKTVDNDRCVMCGSCFSACPGSGISFAPVKKSAKASQKALYKISDKNTGRREFLKKAGFFTSASLSAAVIPSWLVTKKQAFTPDGEKNTPATPPGSKGIKYFTQRCISCHQCVSVCPTRVLKPSFMEYGFNGILQPVMDYRSGYCEFECTDCGKVCPTGAILPFTMDQKKQIQTGRVYFAKERCVVVTNKTICGACAEGCPTHAVGMEPYGKDLDIPVIDNALCIGCGGCEYICPVVKKAIYVKGLEIHGTAEVREPLYRDIKESVPEEFPF